MNNNHEWHDLQDTFDLRELIEQIRKYIWAVILVMTLFGLCGFLGSKYMIEPAYEAATTMIVNSRQNNSGTVTNDSITSAQNLVPTYAVIVKSNTVLNQVIDTLHLDMTYDDLQKNIYVNAVDDTQIMRIAVRNSDRETAIAIVDEISAIAPDIIVDTVEAGSCKVISQVMSGENPVTPNIAKNTLLMIAIGFMLGVIVIAVHVLIKEKRIIDDSDIKKYFDLPVLGVIPEVESECP